MSYGLEVSLDFWKSVSYDTTAKVVEDKFPKKMCISWKASVAVQRVPASLLPTHKI